MKARVVLREIDSVLWHLRNGYQGGTNKIVAALEGAQELLTKDEKLLRKIINDGCLNDFKVLWKKAASRLARK